MHPANGEEHSMEYFPIPPITVHLPSKHPQNLQKYFDITADDFKMMMVLLMMHCNQ